MGLLPAIAAHRYKAQERTVLAAADRELGAITLRVEDVARVGQRIAADELLGDGGHAYRRTGLQLRVAARDPLRLARRAADLVARREGRGIDGGLAGHGAVDDGEGAVPIGGRQVRRCRRQRGAARARGRRADQGLLVDRIPAADLDLLAPTRRAAAWIEA